MIAASIALTSVNLHLWRAGGGTNFFFVSLLGAISLLIGISSYFSKIAPIYPILLNILVGGITFLNVWSKFKKREYLVYSLLSFAVLILLISAWLYHR